MTFPAVANPSVRGATVFAATLWLSLACFACGGCGGSRRAESVSGGRAVLEEVNRAYVTHLRTNRYRPPASREEFKKILQQAGDSALQRAGVKTVDELFVSPRDSQPLVIKYGKDASKLLERGVVAYEQTGVAGRRLVAFDLGSVKEVDENEFKELLPGR